MQKTDLHDNKKSGRITHWLPVLFLFYVYRSSMRNVIIYPLGLPYREPYASVGHCRSEPPVLYCLGASVADYRMDQIGRPYESRRMPYCISFAFSEMADLAHHTESPCRSRRSRRADSTSYSLHQFPVSALSLIYAEPAGPFIYIYQILRAA